MAQELEIKSDSAITDEFTKFLKEFKDRDGEYKYFKDIEIIQNKETKVFYLDYNDLVSTEKTESLCDLLYQEPDRALSFISQSVKDIMSEFDTTFEDIDEYEIPVRIRNWDNKRLLRDVHTTLEGKMLVSDAVITTVSKKQPFLFSSVYICRNCSKIHISTKNEFLKKCLACEDKLVLSKKKSKFTDSRFIHVQELPEDLPAGHLPSKSVMRIYGSDLTRTDQCRPGTRVTITYIVRFDYDTSTLHELKTHDPLGIVENFAIPLELVLEVNNIEKKDTDTNVPQILTDKDIERIEKLKSDRVSLEKTLINSFAPHIYGHEVLKESILLLLVGASFSGKSIPAIESSNSRISIPSRGDLHILLVGNPGVAKSRLLEFAALVSPRSIKTTGRGSTAAGLTAAVIKDEGGHMMLEAGAVVLGDLGLTVIDEFDKLRSEDRSALHEAMEQQTVTITKGGIMATMNSRTSILAAANPVYGAYDLFKSISDNTELPSSLISRFDLIFALPDVVDEERDRSIAKAMLRQHKKDNIIVNQNIFTPEFLSKYLYYIKNHSSMDSILTKGAEKLIEDQYLYYRQFSEKEAGMNVAKTITVTPRIVDALYRLSVARSRLLLKDVVDERDVSRSIALINEMYKSFGIDIENGSNLTLLFGSPLSKKNKNSIFYEVCNALSDSGKIDISTPVLVKDLVRTGRFSEVDAYRHIQEAYKQGILEPHKGDIYTFNKDAFLGGRG